MVLTCQRPCVVDFRRQHADHVGISSWTGDLGRQRSDHDVLTLVRHSRVTEAELVAHIAEVDARRLFAREACSSMFAYCTQRLLFSEAEAYLRIAAARASRPTPTCCRSR